MGIRLRRRDGSCIIEGRRKVRASDGEEGKTITVGRGKGRFAGGRRRRKGGRRRGGRNAGGT